MSNELQHAFELIDLWRRRQDQRPADAERVLEVARHVEDEHRTTSALQALAWQLLSSLHDGSGRMLPSDLALCRCRSAAASISHGCSELIEQISEQIDGRDPPVCILGVLGASRALFGVWDALPGGSAVLMPLHNGREAAGKPEFPAQRGVKWAEPGRLAMVLRQGAQQVSLNGVAVLVPPPEVMAAQTAHLVSTRATTESLIFCAAAHAAVSGSSWHRVNEISQLLGGNGSPTQAVLRLRATHWLGLQVSSTTRVSMAVRRLLKH